jgi:hypothetical protein
MCSLRTFDLAIDEHVRSLTGDATEVGETQLIVTARATGITSGNRESKSGTGGCVLHSRWGSAGRTPDMGKSFSIALWVALLALALGAPAVRADTVSYTGTLSSSTDIADFTVTLASAGTVDLQTYGFGGGTNAVGTVISAGGTDPFLAIFSGTGSGATILTDAFANPFGTSLDLSNYENPDFGGCPPAGAPTIGGSAQCGDITMTLTSLAAGTYTVVLSDGDYIANAVFDNGTLGEGFSDFTGGSFCNLVINGVDCPNTSGSYALDITTSSASASVPEPGTLWLLATGLLAVGFLPSKRRSVSNTSQP